MLSKFVDLVDFTIPSSVFHVTISQDDDVTLRHNLGNAELAL